MTLQRETATLAAGCFWCVEAQFRRLRGVEKVVSGYAGGNMENPDYQQVCTGTTGHAEAVQITFDSRQISFGELLEVFWRIHDPTTLNQQGADIGSQYRSAIFCHDDGQRAIAEQSLHSLEAERIWSDPIVTEIVPYTSFYPAESYHQDYYRSNQEQHYCRIVIEPKLRKLQKNFAGRVKAEQL